ncbi:hypothetical protein GXB82_05525 [Pseudomonas stutzeri]|uniref:hypothetical protein n=1 Tax=Stutzerimonas frequens TaxID=2968969 RepID=UPI000B296C75|nr:hypothetical protein [Stutzerimonas frequens]NCT78277.1 hypothetical protein [Stutzerimonas stutzeri]
MSKNTRHMTMFGKLKAAYRAAEREAAQGAPFYVTEDGGLFAVPNEVIRSAIVKQQLQAFTSLREEKEDLERKANAKAVPL